MWIDRRWLGVGAAVSLLLNVFLIGIVGGHVYAGYKRHPRPKGLGPIVPVAAIRALPDDQRDAYRAALAPHRKSIAAAQRPVREARRVLDDDIAMPTFDRARVSADFQTFREAALRLQEQFNAASVDALAALNQASRAAIVGRTVAPAPDRP